MHLQAACSKNFEEKNILWFVETTLFKGETCNFVRARSRDCTNERVDLKLETAREKQIGARETEGEQVRQSAIAAIHRRQRHSGTRVHIR